MGKIGPLARRFGVGRLVLGVVVMTATLVAAPPAMPSNPVAGPAPAPVAPAPPPADELGRGTPQSSVRGFLEAASSHNFRRAASYLDLRRIPAGDVATRGPALAHQLRVVLDNTVFDLGTLSDEPEGRPEIGLPKNRQLIGRVETDKGTFSILLERVPRADGVPIWQFSNVTVSRIPDLYLSYGIVGERLPAFLVETRVLRLALWQWIGLAVLLAVSWLALRLIEVSSQLVRRRLLRRNEPPSQPGVDFIQRGLKIVVTVLAVLMLLEAVGVQVSALVAAIGIGGIGIALAAQRTVEIFSADSRWSATTQSRRAISHQGRERFSGGSRGPLSARDGYRGGRRDGIRDARADQLQRRHWPRRRAGRRRGRRGAALAHRGEAALAGVPAQDSLVSRG